MADEAPLEVAGVKITHPSRVLFPATAESAEHTKGDAARHYEAVAEHLLPHLVDRPLSVVRCPGGIDDCFYQKHHTGSLPETVDSVTLEERDGQADYLVVKDLEGLLSLVQYGALEFHPWSCRTDRLERPDRLIFDLDPGPGVGWQGVKSAARRVRDRLEELGLTSFLRTTGGEGLHVVTPLERRSSWQELKDFARALAEDLVQEDPEHLVATAAKEKREGKLFLDWLRTGRGATAVVNYSLRARPGATVATPLRWNELDGLESAAAYTLESIPRRLAALDEDPWEGFFDLRQSITAKMQREVGV
ncbi:MAG: non-homologous end-joining DNA ligase [Acidobacteriota bacterium]|nr:non-homologous end-joining DNA ligase [Acidobacteriota bacterium]